MPKSLAFKRTLFLLGLQTSVWRPIVIIEIIIISYYYSYYYYYYYSYSAGFCLDPTALTSHQIDLKLWILIGLGLNWCISPVRPCRVIRSRAITHFVNMVMFQISKTIRPIWTRLDSFESLFNFQKLYKNDFLSQINTKPATPTFIKNGPNFTLFCCTFLFQSCKSSWTGYRSENRYRRRSWPELVTRKISILSIFEKLRYGCSNIVLVAQILSKISRTRFPILF